MADVLKDAARQALEWFDQIASVDRQKWPDWGPVEDALRGALSHPEPDPEAVQVPQGWRMVPEEPTPEMRKAAEDLFTLERKHAADVHEPGDTFMGPSGESYYRSMLAAAPQPPAQAEPCDMGPICIGCEPRGPRGECPGARAEARGDEPVAFAVFWRKRGGDDRMNSVHIELDSARQAIENINNCCSDSPAYYVPLYSRPAPTAPQAGEAYEITFDDFDDAKTADALRDVGIRTPTLDQVTRLQKAMAAALASQPMSREGMSQAAQDVLAERRRQIEAEGWTPEHDDAHHDGTLAQAAGCYATWAFEGEQLPNWVPTGWPWADSWWKPSTPRLNLIRAGALILVELERLDRASAHGIGSGSGSGKGVA